MDGSNPLAGSQTASRHGGPRRDWSAIVSRTIGVVVLAIALSRERLDLRLLLLGLILIIAPAVRAMFFGKWARQMQLEVEREVQRRQGPTKPEAPPEQFLKSLESTAGADSQRSQTGEILRPAAPTRSVGRAGERVSGVRRQRRTVQVAEMVRAASAIARPTSDVNPMAGIFS